MTGEIRNARSIVNFSVTNLAIISSTGQPVSYSFVAPTPTDNGYVARHTISLTDNAFKSGVPMALLTDGQEWHFYLRESYRKAILRQWLQRLVDMKIIHDFVWEEGRG